MNGYDISNNQGDINNGLVPGEFAIIKATEGVGYTDPNCDANYQQAKAAGKALGVYHFARPDGNDPISEANWFVSQIQGYIGEAVPVLDLEVNPITPEWALAFLDRVYELTHVRGWLYMSQSKFNTGDWSAVWPNYAAWVASYGANNLHNGYGAPTAPISINGDWTIVAWQYTSKGILPGWDGDLDLNVAYLDRAGWQRYASGETTPTAPAVETAPVVAAPVPVVEPAPAPVVDTPAPVVTPIPVTTTPTPTQNIPVTNPFDPPTTADGSIFTLPRLSLFRLLLNALKRLFRIK